MHSRLCPSSFPSFVLSLLVALRSFYMERLARQRSPISPCSTPSHDGEDRHTIPIPFDGGSIFCDSVSTTPVVYSSSCVPSENRAWWIPTVHCIERRGAVWYGSNILCSNSANILPSATESDLGSRERHVPAEDASPRPQCRVRSGSDRSRPVWDTTPSSKTKTHRGCSIPSNTNVTHAPSTCRSC